MAKRMTDLSSERSTIGGLRPDRAVVRVRRFFGYGGDPYYKVDGWPLPVPAWMRHLDGRSVRGVVLALGVVAAFACAGAWGVGKLLFRAE